MRGDFGFQAFKHPLIRSCFELFREPYSHFPFALSARPANVAGPGPAVGGAFNVEGEPFAELHAERIDACRLKGAEVQKYIRTARLVLDESEAAVGIPHFQSAGSH